MVIPPVGGNERSTEAQGAGPSAPAKLFAVASPAEDQLPDLPPAEVLDALDTAARVLNELDRKQVSIRLEHDGASQAIRAHVSTGGSGEHEITPGTLLNVLAGDTGALGASEG